MSEVVRHFGRDIKSVFSEDYRRLGWLPQRSVQSVYLGTDIGDYYEVRNVLAGC